MQTGDRDTRIMGVVTDLKTHQLWDVYDRHVVQLDPILAAMSTAGMLIDQEARLALARDLTQEIEQIDEQLQGLVPDSLRPRHPKDGYIRDPTDTTGLQRVVVSRAVVRRCAQCGSLNPTKTHFKPKKTTNLCVGATWVRSVEGTERWAKVLPWIPSPKGILEYAHFHEHTVGKTRSPQGKRHETTEAKSLETLALKYPTDAVYPLLLKRRELEKLRGTYVGHVETGTDHIIGGFTVGADQCVHTMYTHTPSTLRLASEQPNFQNVPRADTPLGRQFRNCFVAPSGQIFVARDYAGIEAVLVGIEAGSRVYTRLSRLGVHDYFNAHLLNARGLLPTADLPLLSWTDATLGEYFADLKQRFPAERQIAKRCVHASNYRVTPFKMWHEYPEMFASEQEANRLQRMYFEVFPEIPTWHERICRQVDKTGYIKNAFGYVHRFYKVISWEKEEQGWQWKRYKRGVLAGQFVYEDDAKRLIAFVPQSGAAGIMKEALLTAHQWGLTPYLRLTIHDEILGIVPVQNADEFSAQLKDCMEQPLHQFPLPAEWGLGPYLTIRTEEKRGETWGACR